MKKVSSYSGFTLIELVVVTAILAVVGMALYGTFANGINIWKKVTQESVTEDVNLFFEKISHELRNSFKMTGMEFRGGKSRVSFPTKIKHKSEAGVELLVKQVTYAFDKRKKTLKRTLVDYSEHYRKRPGREQILAQDISSLRLQYFVYEPEEKKYSWVTHWQEKENPFGKEVEESLPLIVRIEVGIPKGRFEQKFVKTVSIPSACCWPFVDE